MLTGAVPLFATIEMHYHEVSCSSKHGLKVQLDKVPVESAN